MIQTIPKSVTFDEFIAWYPENSPHRYELHDGEIIEMSLPTGKHSKIAGFTDYALKLEEYEAFGIREYWIVDYLGLGGKRFIGNPKQPTITVNQLVNGEYQAERFTVGARIKSPVFPELALMTDEIFQRGR